MRFLIRPLLHANQAQRTPIYCRIFITTFEFDTSRFQYYYSRVAFLSPITSILVDTMYSRAETCAIFLSKEFLFSICMEAGYIHDC